MARNVAEHIRSLLWRELSIAGISSETLGRFTSSRRTILISAHLPSLAQQCALARATGDSGSFDLYFHASISLNPLAAFKPLYISLAVCSASSFRPLFRRFCRTDAPKSLALVSSHLHSRIVKQSFYSDSN